MVYGVVHADERQLPKRPDPQLAGAIHDRHYMYGLCMLAKVS